MAVYTDVTAEELSEFLKSYSIGELLSYKGIAEGVENSNFLLHTSNGYFILTLYEKRVNKDYPKSNILITYGIWMATSLSDILLLGFSDAFARISTLIMSFPSPLAIQSFTRLCE